jgi:hypothetical protein
MFRGRVGDEMPDEVHEDAIGEDGEEGPRVDR